MTDSEGGFILDDDVAFFVPGSCEALITPADGSEPYVGVMRITEFQGEFLGKPIVTIPLEEA